MTPGPAIPRVMHQLYFPTAADAPTQYHELRETVLAHHPAWEHRFWDLATARRFLLDHYPDFVPLFDGYPYLIQRCDAIRFFLLDHFGGVYADMDVEFLSPIDPLLNGRQLVLSRRSGLVGNAVMAGVPSHEIWRSLIAELPARRKRPWFDPRDPLARTQVYYVSRSTGSDVVDEVVETMELEGRPDVLICPGDVLEASPRAVTDPERSIAIHHKGMQGVSGGKRSLSHFCCEATALYHRARRRVVGAT